MPKSRATAKTRNARMAWCRRSPRPIRYFGDGFAYTPEWGAATVIVPWQVHRWYGDTNVLAANYDAMRGYVQFMRDTATDLVPKPGLGDWYDYNAEDPKARRNSRRSN